MPGYALLTLESANRVYGAQAARLLASELLAIAPALHAAIDDVQPSVLGGVDYLTFSATGLDPHDLFVVSNLSGVRAVFELSDGPRLAPLTLTPLAYFDSDLVTIQRYPGKTNEQFTHLMVNLAVAASAAAAERAAAGLPVRVLDPVAGRGTTLNRALTAGYDAAGIEVAEPDVDQYRTFITTYLRDHRIKHRVTKEQVRKGPLAGTSRFSVTIRGGQRLELVRADTVDAADLFPKRSFDVLVADLPYGVHHRAAASGTRRRSPGELLEAALPGWRAVLRNGAGLAFAWNTRTLPRVEVERVLAASGLDVVAHPAPFEHVVDRSITRDVIVARKRRG